MAKRKIDKSREKRIDDEITVDCYGEAERTMGWYCYLEDRLEVPFAAKCIATRSISPEGFPTSGNDCYCQYEIIYNVKVNARIRFINRRPS